MGFAIFFSCCLVALLAVSYAMSAVNSINLPSDTLSGRAFLRRTARRIGVDLSRIPDRVWREIVEVQIARAVQLAALPAPIRTNGSFVPTSPVNCAARPMPWRGFWMGTANRKTARLRKS